MQVHSLREVTCLSSPCKSAGRTMGRPCYDSIDGRPALVPLLKDREALRAMPPNSLGRAYGLRTQRLALHKALFVSDSDTRTCPIPVTKGHLSTYSGHRDRLDRAGLLRAIARAREAKVMTEDDARTLVALVELVGGRLS
jgi:hypothetical protein